MILSAADSYGNVFGSLLYPEAGEPVDLATQLVKNGLAQVRLTQTLYAETLDSSPRWESRSGLLRIGLAKVCQEEKLGETHTMGPDSILKPCKKEGVVHMLLTFYVGIKTCTDSHLKPFQQSELTSPRSSLKISLPLIFQTQPYRDESIQQRTYTQKDSPWGFCACWNLSAM